jgi:hypothetical protein
MAGRLKTKPMFGKKSHDNFAENIGDKQERMARTSLSDLIAFHEQLNIKINQMCSGATPADPELLSCMMSVRERYQNVMRGFKDYNDELLRQALHMFADSVQDMLSHMHLQGDRNG